MCSAEYDKRMKSSSHRGEVEIRFSLRRCTVPLRKRGSGWLRRRERDRR